MRTNFDRSVYPNATLFTHGQNLIEGLFGTHPLTKITFPRMIHSAGVKRIIPIFTPNKRSSGGDFHVGDTEISILYSSAGSRSASKTNNPARSNTVRPTSTPFADADIFT